ncbi:PREDICTED: uncharacterized protein LOC109224105 [Nicotiana attenuata]|uniref:Uncharacterized protein n=1 Tax=Nicotiana attenuata TaxID=49451 RepID=A0A1J6JLI5_NICAT|nr:PREDICTED: uncharacterized protein LOC109224105 [Nicotiana attenuata]OIT07753.1 hypothetical protein A4A49_26279 [Nicotiana attenuata]
MDRWTGILKVPLYANSSRYYRVAASLCLSASTKSLSVPAANAIFFNGDKVEGTGNQVIERLSDLQKVAEILVSKFGNSINAWVVEAPVFNGPFAVYKDFIPSVNEYGEPKSYDADGFPASSSIVLLLWNCLKEAKNVISGKQKEPYQAEVSTSTSSTPRTILLGFSKGGTVLNQLVTELGFAPVQFTEDVSLANKNVTNGGFASLQQDQIIPNSKDSFLNSIAEFHYVDVGLNTQGAYITNEDVIDKISERLVQGAPGIRFFLHGTPRQWCDGRRIWIRKEKDEFFRLLRGATRKNMGKLYIRERLYFGNRLPELQIHFEIMEHLDVS